MARHVLIISPNLNDLHQGEVYSGEDLGMTDEQLDIMVQKGYALHHLVDVEPSPAEAPERAPRGKKAEDVSAEAEAEVEAEVEDD